MIKKVLSIEDSPATQQFITLTLKSNGYDVITANDGIEGMQKLAIGKFDLIILDIMMPKMNGLDVLREMKENQELSKMPIVMLTADQGEEGKKMALELGATSFLTKPFQPLELLESVTNILG